jgi:hypothetical protein
MGRPWVGAEAEDEDEEEEEDVGDEGSVQPVSSRLKVMAATIRRFMEEAPSGELCAGPWSRPAERL